MRAPLDLFAACQPGLEPQLAGELRGLGLEPRPLPGGVAFPGDVGDAMRCCLWLGTASHVRIRLARFPCRALGELERKAAEVPWPEWLLPHVPVAIHATTRKSRVYHTGAVAERVERALARAFGRDVPRAGGAADSEDGEDTPPAVQLHARFADDVCTLSLDASATPLHRRGYRLDVRKAPLREDLAHALVLASGRSPDEALLDPFCGSGTIAIEAAGLALGLPPGRLRPPPLEHLALFDADLWQAIATGWQARPAAAPIAASDRDAGAIDATRANAARAGVADAIDCQVVAVGAQPWLRPDTAPPRGVVVSNPPFGLRVRGGSSLLPLYQTLGHRLLALGAGWRAALLAHDVRLMRRTGLPLAVAFTTRHGGLSVTAMVTPGGAPGKTERQA